MHPRIVCPICGETAREVFAQYPGYQEPYCFDLAACTACHTGFVLGPHEDTTPIYEAIYRNAENVPGYGRYWRYAQEVLRVTTPLEWLAAREPAYWAIHHHLLNTRFSANDLIAEVGSGLGYLTYALNKHGYHTTGIDVSGAAVGRATAAFGGNYIKAELSQFGQANAGRYRFVIATEVIEHISDPYSFFESGLKLLQPGGEFLITTPNRDACSMDIVWDVEAPPVHLWWFSWRSFQAMARRLSCKVKMVDLSSHPASSTWSQHVLGDRPMPMKRPVLDREGRVIRHRRPKPVLIRAVLKLGRIATIATRRISPFSNSSKEKTPCLYSPTLCVAFEKEGKCA